MVWQKKRNYKRKSRRMAKSSARKVSKPLARAIKQVVKRQVETKTLTVPLAPGGTVNSGNIPYGALSGVQYLCQDLWRQNQGTANSTAISLSNGNRVGDKIQAIGFLMDYYFTTKSFYTVGATSFFIPFVKMRITAFRQAFGTPLLATSLIYDENILLNLTSTLQPINWDEGYVKDVLYDKTFIIRNNNSVQAAGTGTFPQPLPDTGNVMHFKKYIKFPHVVKYCDNNTVSPNSTDKPIYVVISAEVDDANAGLVPSGTKILFSTGYTRGWFKDA